jgi:hypothetical protein
MKQKLATTVQSSTKNEINLKLHYHYQTQKSRIKQQQQQQQQKAPPTAKIKPPKLMWSSNEC